MRICLLLVGAAIVGCSDGPAQPQPAQPAAASGAADLIRERDGFYPDFTLSSLRQMLDGQSQVRAWTFLTVRKQHDLVYPDSLTNLPPAKRVRFMECDGGWITIVAEGWPEHIERVEVQWKAGADETHVATAIEQIWRLASVDDTEPPAISPMLVRLSEKSNERFGAIYRAAKSQIQFEAIRGINCCTVTMRPAP